MSKKAPNFSDDEIHILLDAVELFRGVIENKKTNAVTWGEKDEAWKKVSVAYNASVITSRTPGQLRCKYESLKKEARKSAASESFRTGDGPMTKIRSAIHKRLTPLMGGLSTCGLYSPYDSDSLRDGAPNESKAGPMLESMDDTSEEMNDIGGWSSYSHSTFKRRKHSALKEESSSSDNNIWTEVDVSKEPAPSTTPLQSPQPSSSKDSGSWFNRRHKKNPEKRESTSGNSSVLAEVKTELARLQLQILEEQQRYQREEHALKLAILREELKSKELDVMLQKIELEKKRKEIND